MKTIIHVDNIFTDYALKRPYSLYLWSHFHNEWFIFHILFLMKAFKLFFCTNMWLFQLWIHIYSIYLTIFFTLYAYSIFQFCTNISHILYYKHIYIYIFLTNIMYSDIKRKLNIALTCRKHIWCKYFLDTMKSSYSIYHRRK